MRLLVTGSSGFLGKYVVAKALHAGYFVRALIRSHLVVPTLPWSNHPLVEFVEADLAESLDLGNLVSGVDAVIHLAASKSADFSEAYQGTVVSTERLLGAMEREQVWRLVAISSFSVYDYSHIENGQDLVELSPLEKRPNFRDAYAQTKLLQEEIVRQFAYSPSASVTILRPGMVYGPGELWTACQGAGLGLFWLLIGGDSKMPLTYVENCADAIISAVSLGDAVGTTINIVDDDLPTRRAYTQALVRDFGYHPLVLPISWPFFRRIAQTACFVNRTFLFGNLNLPGLLVPQRLDARLKPLQYPNDRAKKVLGWQPKYSWEEALVRCQDEDCIRSSLLG